jgi:outer membrane protein insertion porin family
MRGTATGFYILLTVCTILGVQSCQLSQYPAGKPYAAKVKINVIGDYSEEERKDLEKKLTNQVDDSLRYSREQKKWLRIFPYYRKIYHAYDTNNIIRTKAFFNAAYVANGYFRGGETTDSVIYDPGNASRHIIVFNARPRKNHRIDTVVYDIAQPQMQQLVLDARKDSYLKKNDLYSQTVLNAERERLVSIFRNKGYLKIEREDFKVVADTINPWLVKPTTDPFEQLQNLQKADAFNRNPTTGIRFTLVNTIDSSRLHTYYVGNIIINPDNIDAETVPPGVDSFDFMVKRFFRDNYKNKIFKRNIFLRKGALYRQDDYIKTLNTFNFMGPWQQVLMQPVIDSASKTDTVNFKMMMLPYPKFLSERKLEGSINSYSSDGSQQANNSLWGINASQTIKNRNFNHEAIQTSFVANIGLELGGSEQFVNSAQGRLGYNMLLPKFTPWWPGSIFKGSSLQKTLLSSGASYTQRFKFFELFDVNLAHNYQFKTKRNWVSQVSFANIERKFLNRTDSLNKQIELFPILAFIFNDGLILSSKFTSTKIFNPKKNTNSGSIRLSGELSGLPYCFLDIKELDNNLFSFGKLEADYRHYKTWNPKSSLAFRAFAGLGVPFRKRHGQNQYLPFFKQFTAGGPNSLRGWAIRNLNSYSTRTGSSKQIDFYGDIQAEVNLEYRRLLGKLAGIPIRTAFFIDAGNIWNWKPYDTLQVPYNLPATTRIYNDIAIAAGTSLRIDFDYFLIRLDFAIRVKDPLFSNENHGWFVPSNFRLYELSPIKMQLGINYPF